MKYIRKGSFPTPKLAEGGKASLPQASSKRIHPIDQISPLREQMPEKRSSGATYPGDPRFVKEIFDPAGGTWRKGPDDGGVGRLIGIVTIECGSFAAMPKSVNFHVFVRDDHRTKLVWNNRKEHTV